MPTDEQGIKDLRRILQDSATVNGSGADHFTRMEEAAKQMAVLYPTGYNPVGVADDYPDPAALANAEFAPQFAALEALAKAQKQRYDVSNADMGRMYESLAQSTLNRVPVVKEGFDATGKQIGQNYLDTSNKVTDNYSKSANELASLMERLGIQQAAPTVFAQSQKELGTALGDLASRSLNNVDTNTRLGQNEVTYLGRTADTNRLAGKNQQADLMKQLLALQAQNDASRSTLQAQKAAAANQYSIGIAKSKQDSAQAQLAAELKKAGLELDAAKFAHLVDMDTASLNIKTQDSLYGSKDPSAILSNRAYSVFNGDSQAASNATLSVMNAYQDSGGQSLVGMLDAINKMPTANPQDKDKYKQLAVDFWNRVKG